MSDPPFDLGQLGPPPFVAPYLRTLDRLQRRQAPRPEAVTEQALAFLHERFGVAGVAEVAFAHGALGLLAGHTHYHDGFAMLLPLRHGTALALRATDARRSRLAFQGRPETWTFDASAPELAAWPSWPRVVAALAARLGEGRQVEAAVVSTVPPSCVDTYLATLGVATVRALQALFALPHEPTSALPTIDRVLVEATDMPFSPVYALAAEVGRPGSFLLADSASGEYLPLEGPAPEMLAWGLVEVGGGWLFDAARHQKRRTRADAVLAQLQQRGYPKLTSLRDLEHQELDAALRAVSRRYRPVLRHLVLENRRVQRLVVAARRDDWQLFGALLLMSHASLRDEWGQTHEAVDAVVAEVEAMTLDGMYGASVTGRGGCVLVAGAPPAVPVALDRIERALAARQDRPPSVVLL